MKISVQKRLFVELKKGPCYNKHVIFRTFDYETVLHNDNI